MGSDPSSLLVVGLAYLFITIVWVLTLAHRANILLREVKERIDPALWDELGAPASMKAAIADPERRWTRFIRSGEYKKRCSTDVIGLIDDHRSRTNRMLIILGIAAGLILYRFWPLLAPPFFGQQG